MGSGLDKIKRKAPAKAPDQNNQDVYTITSPTKTTFLYSFGQRNTESNYMNIGDVFRDQDTQIITIPLDSTAASQDNSEYIRRIGLAASSCKNDNAQDDTNTTHVRREADGRQDETDWQINENVIVDVDSDCEESDYQSLGDSGCGSTRSACANSQTCLGHKTDYIPIGNIISEEDPVSLLPKMAEVFRPLIVDSILVSEILPYMTLQVDKSRLLCIEKSSTKEAVSILLDQIIASEELGKWTMFLDALKRTGYEYVAKLLMGETEKDLTVHRKLLQIFTPHIVENLDPKELTDILFAKDLISMADKEEIENKQKYKNTSAATLVLLDRIPRRKDNWFEEFVVALRECGYEFVADELNIQECIPSPACKGMQYQSPPKPRPCVNRPSTGAAHPTSASGEEARSQENLYEEENMAMDEEEEKFIKEKGLLMKILDEKQRKAQQRKQIEALKQNIEELDKDELETEDRKRKEILRQEKESLIKKHDEKRQLAELQLEIEQLKKNTTELENACNENSQYYSSDKQNEGQNHIKSSPYVEIENPGETAQSILIKAEVKIIAKELLENEIVPDIIATVTSRIITALQQPNNENNLDYSNIMCNLKSLNFESLHPAPVFQNDTLSMEAMQDNKHDYDYMLHDKEAY